MNPQNGNLKLNFTDKFKTAYEKPLLDLVERDRRIPTNGGGNIYRLPGGNSYDSGSYELENKESIIRLREAEKTPLSLTEAKLPKPVKISNLTIVQDQVAVNVANFSKIGLNDLNNEAQQKVVGLNRLKNQIERNKRNIEFFKNIRKDNPIITPISESKANKLKKAFLYTANK